MKTVILLISVMGYLACAVQQPTSPAANAPSNGIKIEATPAISAPLEEAKAVEVPARFQSVDFANFSYPTKYFGTVKLTSGQYEKAQNLGGTTISFGSVDYADLNGDQQPEAVVRLNQLICGGSCDGGSTLFYFFTIRNRKPVLLSRLETGSVAYTCGLKSFDLRGGKLTLETFRRCRLAG